MSDTLLSTLYSDISIDVPGCPDRLMLRSLNRTMRDICKRVPLIKHTAAIWLIPGRSCYSLDLPSKRKIGFIDDVTYDGSIILATNETMRSQRDPTWRTKEAEDPTHYLQENLGSIRIFPIPTVSKANAISVELSLIPTKDEDEFDDELIDRYEQLLIDGALSWLFARPNQKWTDLQQAQLHYGLYEGGIENAAIDAMRSNVKSDLTMKLKPLA